MYVIHTGSARKVPVIISRIDKPEISLINKSRLFHFNWNKEVKYEVYKLNAYGANEPLGLMSLEVRPLDYAIEVRLLALSKGNIGNNKEHDRIAGCMIAFACKKSFAAGYDGYVCLKPKTELAIHYQNKYGMTSTAMYLITEGQNSLKLIKEYYE